MSAYSGPQGAGAAARHARAKRDAAKTRQRHHDQAVLRYAIANAVDEDEARKALRLVRHLEHVIGGAR